jgi:hypothetical protein
MKTDKRREKASTEIRTPAKFPLELVAATALQFSGEDDSRADQQDAVDRAIAFLELCAENVEGNRSAADERSKMLEELRSLGWEPSDTVPYNKGVKFVTGQKRLDRAKADFETYLKYNCLQQEPLRAAELAAAIKKHEKEGFVASWLHLHRVQCSATLASSRSGVRRHRKKLQET